MIDPVAALRAFLLSDANINAAVGGRVYGAPPGLPEGTTNPPPASIVIQQAGGSVSPVVPIIDPRYYVRVYGPDGRTASNIFGLIAALCKDAAGRLICNRVVANKYFLYWCQVEALSAPTIEAESNWPVALGTLHARWDELAGA